MLKDKLQQQITDALKGGDQIRVSTLRLLANALHNEQIAKQAELSEDDEIAIVKRQLKQREEAAEAYQSADRPESAEKERREAEILKEFLPEQMGEQQIRELVNQVIGELGTQEFGRIIGEVMKRAGGKADGKVVAEQVKQKLGN